MSYDIKLTANAVDFIKWNHNPTMGNVWKAYPVYVNWDLEWWVVVNKASVSVCVFLVFLKLKYHWQYYIQYYSSSIQYTIQYYSSSGVQHSD